MNEEQKKMLDDTFSNHRKLGQQEEAPEKPVEKEQEEEEETSGKATGEEEEPGEGEEGGKDEREQELNPEDEISQIFEPEGGEEAEGGEEEDDPGGDDPTEISLDLTDDEFDDITTNREAFGKYTNKVYNKALTEARAEFKQELANAKEELLRNIPDVVGQVSKRAMSVRQASANFFKENPELKNKTDYVRDMTTMIAGQNPDWDATQVLSEVGKRAKRDLQISEKANERESERRRDPKFAGNGGRRAPAGTDQRTNQQKLLDDTFSRK